MDIKKISPVIERFYDPDRHVLLQEATSLIQTNKDYLDEDKFNQVIESKALHIYEFKGKQYVDRLDLGRVFHDYHPKTKGLTVERYFTKVGEDPFESVNYFNMDTEIKDFGTGKTIFEMKDVEFPEWMDKTSANIVASKYFFNPESQKWKDKINASLGRDHEYSLKHLSKRVADFFTDEGHKLGYFKTAQDKENFRNEFYFLQINGMLALNSPVQFNAGLFNSYGIKGSPGINYWKNPETGKIKRVKGGEYIHPQLHACFIKGPKDGLESILQHGLDEGAVFASGSGIGHNAGAIREEGAKLSGGGTASGPKSFTKSYDVGAGTIKSGGKTRRAARMTTMRQSHPDVEEFTEMKLKEDKKALELMKRGYSQDEAYETVSFQNTNFSIRLDNHFFKQVETDGEIELKSVKDDKVTKTISAKKLLQKISFGSWRIGDPAVQYESKMQEMHTVPNSGRQNSTNPCGEYSFLDNTSCNLLSQNLLKFMNKDGSFDVERYQKSLKIGVIAQDIANKAASYPIKEIARISPEFASIGTGDLAIGSYLMRKGIAYDSDKARAIRGAFAALLTGTVYEVSTEMAENLGTFEHFEFNKKPMINVLKKHQKNLENIAWDLVGDEFLKEEITKTWENVISRGEKNGFRNAQATVLAPTGTISFLMGYPTTGIEPAISLNIRKNLAGGGHVIIANKDVNEGLKHLGYNVNQIEIIEEYIAKNNTARGAPILHPDHYAVFDTAIGNSKGEGSINLEGHLKMMAAAQPFISGGLSKTNNLPENATVKEVYEGYILGHELGLKGVTIFRRNSKPIAAMSFGDNNFKEFKRGEKDDLPQIRNAKEIEFEIQGEIANANVHLIVSEYDDGRPGQVAFLSYKAGSTLGSLLSTAGVSASKSLKRGVHLIDATSGWEGQQFEPHGLVKGHPYIKTANSILDFADKFLRLEYLGDISLANDPSTVDIKKLRGFQNGAFETYRKANVDDWNLEQVLEDPFLGGFVEKTEEQLAREANGNNDSDKNKKSKGRICSACGNIMQQISSNCFECTNCTNKIGGCGG